MENQTAEFRQINMTYQSTTVCLDQVRTFVTERVQNTWIACDHETLNESQGHLNW